MSRAAPTATGAGFAMAATNAGGINHRYAVGGKVKEWIEATR